MDYNGGSVIAMVGKDCVAIASDLRLGNQALGVSSNFQKVCTLYHSLPPVLILCIDISHNRPHLPWFTRIGNGCDNFASLFPVFECRLI
jgi:hypothetical protein